MSGNQEIVLLRLDVPALFDAHARQDFRRGCASDSVAVTAILPPRRGEHRMISPDDSRRGSRTFAGACKEHRRLRADGPKSRNRPASTSSDLATSRFHAHATGRRIGMTVSSQIAAALLAGSLRRVGRRRDACLECNGRLRVGGQGNADPNLKKFRGQGRFDLGSMMHGHVPSLRIATSVRFESHTLSAGARLGSRPDCEKLRRYPYTYCSYTEQTPSTVDRPPAPS